MIVPCRNCNDRDSECHGRCEKYKKWREYNESIKHKRRIAAQLERLKWHD